MLSKIIKPRHNYYPFGSSLTTRGFSAGNGFRFGFNGKEFQSELNNIDYDFGARIYNGRLGRWFSLDPQRNHFATLSPYVFSVNSCLILNDPDGEKPIITISDKIIGYAYQRVAWINPLTKEHGGTNLIIKVPVYQVIIENVDEKTGKVISSNSTYGAIRDAWAIETDFNKPPNTNIGKSLHFKNYGYEPTQQGMNFNLKERNDYPEGSGLPAYNIFYNGKNKLPADKTTSNFSSQLNMLIHVGGIYFNPIDKEARPVYSLGCFGIVSASQINQKYQEIIDTKKNLSNSTMAAFSIAVENVKKLSVDKSINLKINKRGGDFIKFWNVSNKKITKFTPR